MAAHTSTGSACGSDAMPSAPTGGEIKEKKEIKTEVVDTPFAAEVEWWEQQLCRGVIWIFTCLFTRVGRSFIILVAICVAECLTELIYQSWVWTTILYGVLLGVVLRRFVTTYPCSRVLLCLLVWLLGNGIVEMVCLLGENRLVRIIFAVFLGSRTTIPTHILDRLNEVPASQGSTVAMALRRRVSMGMLRWIRWRDTVGRLVALIVYTIGGSALGRVFASTLYTPCVAAICVGLSKHRYRRAASILTRELRVMGEIHFYVWMWMVWWMGLATIHAFFNSLYIFLFGCVLLFSVDQTWIEPTLERGDHSHSMVRRDLDWRRKFRKEWRMYHTMYVEFIQALRTLPMLHTSSWPTEMWRVAQEIWQGSHTTVTTTAHTASPTFTPEIAAVLAWLVIPNGTRQYMIRGVDMVGGNQVTKAITTDAPDGMWRGVWGFHTGMKILYEYSHRNQCFYIRRLHDCNMDGSVPITIQSIEYPLSYPRIYDKIMTGIVERRERKADYAMSCFAEIQSDGRFGPLQYIAWPFEVFVDHRQCATPHGIISIGKSKNRTSVCIFRGAQRYTNPSSSLSSVPPAAVDEAKRASGGANVGAEHPPPQTARKANLSSAVGSPSVLCFLRESEEIMADWYSRESQTYMIMVRSSIRPWGRRHEEEDGAEGDNAEDGAEGDNAEGAEDSHEQKETDDGSPWFVYKLPILQQGDNSTSKTELPEPQPLNYALKTEPYAPYFFFVAASGLHDDIRLFSRSSHLYSSCWAFRLAADRAVTGYICSEKIYTNGCDVSEAEFESESEVPRKHMMYGLPFDPPLISNPTVLHEEPDIVRNRLQARLYSDCRLPSPLLVVICDYILY